MPAESIHWTAIIVFFFFLVVVAGQGFIAAYRQKTGKSLNDWGLGGRQFGVLFTLVIIGGDFYTAYTVIAVPAKVYGSGALGFFALPFTIIVYPFFYAVMPRLWMICKKKDYMTAADFVQGRSGSIWLATAVALTSVLAMVPYIALQLVGIEVVLEHMGIGHGTITFVVSFLLLAFYTYHSGLKAPAMLSFGKAIMIFIVIIIAVIWIPIKLGGFGAIFAAADDYFKTHPEAKGGLLLTPAQFLPYASLALGSALAGFMYPHALTGVLSSSGAATIQKNAFLLPVFTILLGLIALLGYMAIAVSLHVDTNSIVPALFNLMFPEWFVGFAFAAIVIGALVPAAIMAIGTATLFTRNIWKALFQPNIAPTTESILAKRASVVVLFFSLCFVILVPTEFAIDLQLIGGICILQIFPAVVFGLYRNQIHALPYFIGWAAGMSTGIGLMLANHLKTVYTLSFMGYQTALFIGLIALGVNIVISCGGSILMSLAGIQAKGTEVVDTLQGENV